MVRSWAWAAWAVVGLASSGAAQTLLASDVTNLGIDDGAITPDGRLGVMRENSSASTARIVDMATGQLLSATMSSLGAISGAAQDAVAVTNTRAVVLGSSVMVLDLTNPTAPLLAEHDAGTWPRDVEITPDGTKAVVRGGSAGVGTVGELLVLDLTSGAVLATGSGSPGNPNATAHTYNVDSVVTNDQFGLCLSIVGVGSSAHTRVTIFDLSPAGGGAPFIAYQTGAASGATQDQLGAPHDVALSPDGRYAAVRSEASVGLYDLSGSTPARVWHKRLFGDPGPMGFTSMDSIELSDTHVVTASRWTGAGFGAQVDIFDFSGTQWFSRVRGDPHDVVITPDGRLSLLRTHRALFMFDLAHLPAAPRVLPIDHREMLATHTFYGAGYDSIAVTNELAVAVARVNGSAFANVFDISADTLQMRMQTGITEKPVDVALSPDASWLAITGTTFVSVIDLLTRRVAFQHDPLTEPIGFFPWCDGVEIDNGHVLAFGVGQANFNAGWYDVIALFPAAQNYCAANPNSSGEAAHLHAVGSNSVQADDMSIWCTGLPFGANGTMVYATGQASTPLGGGILCLSGQRYFMPMANAVGTMVEQAFDYSGSTSMGGAISAGSTWNFQFRYRDPLASGPQFNLSDGLSVTFTN